MIFLIDHNLNGHGMIFFGAIANQSAITSFISINAIALELLFQGRILKRATREFILGIVFDFEVPPHRVIILRY